MTADNQLTHFSKYREKIVRRVKGSESLSIQGQQYAEEYLVIRERFPSRTERPSVIEPGNDWNHAPVSQAQNAVSSSNTQEIPVSMENVRPEGTEDQSATSPSGEDLRRNVYLRRSKCIRKSPQWYEPGFGATREWNNDAVASIVYMIQDGYLNSNVDTNDTLS